MDNQLNQRECIEILKKLMPFITYFKLFFLIIMKSNEQTRKLLKILKKAALFAAIAPSSRMHLNQRSYLCVRRLIFYPHVQILRKFKEYNRDSVILDGSQLIAYILFRTTILPRTLDLCSTALVIFPQCLISVIRLAIVQILIQEQ